MHDFLFVFLVEIVELETNFLEKLNFKLENLAKDGYVIVRWMTI